MITPERASVQNWKKKKQQLQRHKIKQTSEVYSGGSGFPATTCKRNKIKSNDNSTVLKMRERNIPS